MTKHVSANVFRDCHGAKHWHHVVFRSDQDPTHVFIGEADYFESIAFCRETMQSNWFKSFDDFWFEDQTEAIAFKLRYG